MATKSNIDHIRDIIGKSQFENPISAELYEFLDAAEEEISDLEQEVKELKKENEAWEAKADDGFGESVYLGLDTLNYELQNGNLKIQIQLDHWIEQVQKQNGVIPTPKPAKMGKS